jgi:hypothetical protein
MNIMIVPVSAGGIDPAVHVMPAIVKIFTKCVKSSTVSLEQ